MMSNVSWLYVLTFEGDSADLARAARLGLSCLSPERVAPFSSRGR